MIDTRAVWRAARAAVRRRRLQTFVIGLVVLLSTMTVVAALALLSASSAPFDAAFAGQHGAHVVAAFDPARVTGAQLAAARPAGVEATAGPFGQTVLDVPPGGPDFTERSLNVVGRPGPGGPVDRLDLWAGRWATGPGEIVLNSVPFRAVGPPTVLGGSFTTPDGTRLTVVGRAYSVSRTADAWVSPDQMAALHPAATQMLYRFAGGTVRPGAVAAGLPAGALLSEQSYLTVKAAVAAGPGVYVPFLMVFAVLGLLVAVLIVGNVVSGAVVSGFRQIGILKAIGFTPRQVVAVHVLMVLVPAAAGTLLGVGLGYLGAQPLLQISFQGLGFGGDVGVDPRVIAAALPGVPALVALAALVPALRAYRLPAALAISAGSAPRAGRGLRVQRRLSGTRLPRAVSLGLGLPFARPGRSLLTLAAVLLGVVTVTFATGLTASVNRYADAAGANNAAPVAVRPGDAARGQTVPALSDAQIEALLRALPGTGRLTASVGLPVAIVGQNRAVDLSFQRGDAPEGLTRQVVAGRWLRGPGELVLTSQALRQRGLAVGDRVTLQLAEHRGTATIVGETLSGGVGGSEAFADWQLLTGLAPDYRIVIGDMFYQIRPAPGAGIGPLVQAVNAAAPGLYAWDNRGTNSFTVAVIGFSSTLSLLLGIVAALGVLNTVALNVRDRRRDIGMLKAVGMTPRQVVVMTVTSMVALGALGGLLGVPLGMAAHRLVVPAAARAAQVDTADFMLDVWPVRMLAALALAGVAIAALGAFLPARSAARLPIAEVLHNE